MGVPPERVERLLEQHADRAEVERRRLDRVPNAPIRELFERRHRHDPGLSATAVARRAGLSGATHLLRELGLAPTSATVKNGVRYPPRVSRRSAWIRRRGSCAPWAARRATSTACENGPRRPPVSGSGGPPRRLSADRPRMGHAERINRRREKVAEVVRLRREDPELTLAEIAARVEETFWAPCAVKTVKDYLWDPTGEKARQRNAGYCGRCENCGAVTSGGDGPGRARERCRRCGAHGRQRHSRESIVAALREWERRFGARPTSYDLSRHWAARRGGAALERWEAFALPAQAVTREFRTFRAALTAAFSQHDLRCRPRLS